MKMKIVLYIILILIILFMFVKNIFGKPKSKPQPQPPPTVHNPGPDELVDAKILQRFSELTNAVNAAFEEIFEYDLYDDEDDYQAANEPLVDFIGKASDLIEKYETPTLNLHEEDPDYFTWRNFSFIISVFNMLSEVGLHLVYEANKISEPTGLKLTVLKYEDVFTDYRKFMKKMICEMKL